MVNSVIKLIKDNENILNQIAKEDAQVNPFEWDIHKLLGLLETFQNRTRMKKEKRKILVEHYGNPYVTALLCLEGFFHQAEMVIGIEDFCYGLNQAIVKIMNGVLPEPKILLQNHLTLPQIEEIKPDKVVCLGNSNAYMRFRKMKNIEVQKAALFEVSVFYDDEAYEELVEKMRNYANQHFFEMEIFDETEDFEEVLYQIKHSQNQYCAVILSKDKEKQEKFKQEIHTKMVCVNENPFAKFELKIPAEIF